MLSSYNLINTECESGVGEQIQGLKINICK